MTLSTININLNCVGIMDLAQRMVLEAIPETVDLDITDVHKLTQQACESGYFIECGAERGFFEMVIVN